MTPARSPRQIRREGALLLLLALLPALLSVWLHPKPVVWSWHQPNVTEVDLAEITRWSPPILWVDARSSAAYQTQHIPGAISLNEDAWASLFPHFLEAWQPSAKVVVYCDTQACDASQAVALRLEHDLKLTEIHVLKGGWATWQKNHQ